eukprot:TRINITY_DN28235_c0_g1_i1.p1 TRINITY_DN28235_c0_g1~~TRINITY_DN28235_c0_g1_i1.p1  ORF type:complete len:1014 (+),score=216.38 TRINITY_DN28235_c0_g1_i1:152-3193(+)
MATTHGNIMSGMVQVCSRRIERGKSRGMANWHKRFAVVAIEGDRARLKLFKNDQEIMPKEVVELAELAENPRAGGDKRRQYSVTLHIRGQSWKLRLASRTERDQWLAAFREAGKQAETTAADADSDYLEAFRERLPDWQRTLQAAAGVPELRLFFELASFGALPAAEHAACFAELAKGQWIEVLAHAIAPLTQGGLAAAGFVRTSLEHIVVRRHRPGIGTATSGGSAWYDKVTLTLQFCVQFADGQLRHPPVADLQSLLAVPHWQVHMDRRLQSDADWQAACNAVQRALGQPQARVVCDLARGIGQYAADRWAHRWITADLVNQVAAALAEGVRAADDALSRSVPAGCPALPSARGVLAAWAQGVSLSADEARVSERRAPIVRVHRTSVRHHDSGTGLSRQAVNLFNRCRGADTGQSGSPALLCSGTVEELQGHLVDALHHARLVELARQAERIHVAPRDGGDEQMQFAVDWDGFISCCRDLGTSPKVRMKLAMQLVSQYPPRAQGVVDALGLDWGLYCRTLPRVNVVFASHGGGRSHADGAVLFDVCRLLREARDALGRQSAVVMRFDVPDLGSFARGFLAGVLHGPRPQAGGGGLPPAEAIGSSSDDGGGSATPDTSSDSDGLRRPPRVPSGSPVARRRSLGVESLVQREVGPTQYADDAPLTLQGLPQCIASRLAESPNAALYPFSTEDVARTAAALDAAFQPEVMAPETMLDVVTHAVGKLRMLFAQCDPQQTGSVPVSDLPAIGEAFEEYQASPGALSAADIVGRIVAAHRSSGHVSFSEVAPRFMESLLPSDVRKSVQCKRSVLLCGLQKTGKTLLLCALRQRPVDQTEATLGSRPEVISFDRLNLSVTEIGGSEEERKNWSLKSKHVDEVHGVCFVVDVTRDSLFETARQYLREILSSKHLKRVPLLLLLNNARAQPGDQRALQQRVVAELKVAKYCEKSKRRFHVCCVHIVSPQDVSPDGVDADLAAAFRWLAGRFQRAGAPQSQSPRRCPVLRRHRSRVRGRGG